MSELQLVLNGVGKHRGGRWIVRDVSLAWRSPGVVALWGPNGSGKTTLLRLLGASLEPDLGTIQVCGHDLQKHRTQALTHVGVAPTVQSLPDHLRVRELLSLVSSLRNTTVQDTLVAAEDLELDTLLNERCSTLSLGQKRRVTLAVAYAGRPSILLLDEPTNGLDAHARDRLIAWMKQQARTHIVVVATHDEAFVNAVASSRWEICEGSVREASLIYNT